MALQEKEKAVQSNELKETETPYYAYLPMDILYSIGDLKYGKRIDRGEDYFFPVTFKGRTCHIETPKCLYMWKLDKYKNPGGKFEKFSINLSLREICREAENGHNVTNFKYMLENLDLFAMRDDFDNNEMFKYTSPICISYKDTKKPPTLRVKVPSDGKRLKVTIVKEDGKETFYPTIAEFEETFKHRNEVKCIIEVCNIWYAGGRIDKDPSKRKPKKYGISYKLVKIQLADAGRRIVQFR